MYKIGDRIELHPATDLWIRGARYGTIVATKIGSESGAISYRVQLDRNGQYVTLYADDIGRKV